MKKILFMAMSVFAVAAHAESAMQSVQLRNTTVKLTEPQIIAALDGKAINVTKTTAVAATIANVSCPEQNNGTFDKTGLICSNGKWQDATTLPKIDMLISEVDPKTNAVYETSGSTQFLGVRSIRQTSDGHRELTLLATVVALNSDNTAHVVIDLGDADWRQHVDTTVPLDVSTAVATDMNGGEYRVKVERHS